MIPLQLKHIRSERQRREEILALAELRASIDALSQVDASNREQAEKVEALTFTHVYPRYLT